MKSRSDILRIPDGKSVSALWLKPRGAFTCFVFAHGAGADMNHPFMTTIAEKLASVKIASLRYQFPYMEAGSRRPDRPAVCHATVRTAVAAAHQRTRLPIIAGGKSFGGRMTSQAQADEPMAGVIGLAFFGFPWHTPKAPSAARGKHLRTVSVPMLFLQGARDPMGDAKLVKTQVRRNLKHSTLISVPDADHGFHVPVRSGRTDTQVQDNLVEVFLDWALTLTRPVSARPEAARRTR